jgi:hypothetical protein
MREKLPYLVSVIVFALILFVGRFFLDWGETGSAYLLLFFLLVAIGIRLDEIAKKLNTVNDRLDHLLKDRPRAMTFENAPPDSEESPEPSAGAGHPLSPQ